MNMHCITPINVSYDNMHMNYFQLQVNIPGILAMFSEFEFLFK